jgi:hypothetical protein
MDVLCTADMCPVILNATCVFYEGNTLIYTGITTNDNLQTALQKIDAKFGDAMVGYTFTNGINQPSAGAPVGLGGNLTANTSIGGNFTLTFTGNLQATKHITTGGTASQFVKGDGTLDGTAYQAAGNYITALTGDVIAAGPGSVNASLAVVNSNPGTYGSSTRIPIVTVDTKGRVTALTTTAVSVPSGILSFVGDVYGSGVTGSATTLTLSNVNTNVYTNNTFLKFKVNAKGLVTGAALITHVDIEGVLGYVPVPETRKLSINGVQHDLQSDIYWTIATGVSGVTASAPLVSSGGAVPNISIPKADATTDGYLDNVDWVTFNNKVPTSRTLTINGVSFDLAADRTWTINSMVYPGAGIAVSTGTGWGTSLVDNSTNWNTAYTERISSASAPLSITSNTISISQANTSTNGYLSSGDWTTFNNKQASGNYITDLTGEATATGPGIATVTLSTPAVTSKVLTGVNITGGTVVATDTILEGFGKLQNQINALIGGSIYQGVWDAATNTPTLVSSVGTDGYYYIVNVAGNTNLNGITNWNVGDWAIFHGGVWQKVDNTDAVVSVNGYTGAVSLVSSDIAEGLTNLYFTNTRARQALSLTTTGSSGAATYDNTTGVFNIPQYQSVLTNPITGSGTLNYVPKFNTTSSIANSNIQDSGSLITLGSNTTISSGGLQIGGNTLGTNSLRVGKNLTGGTTIYVVNNDGSVQSDVTTDLFNYNSALRTTAATFTLTNFNHYVAQLAVLGAGSAVTNQIGFLASSSLTSATNNYGFRGLIPSGTGRWNLYMDGTANNYMAGSLGIGVTNITGYNARINKSLTGATTAYGVSSEGAIQSDVTSSGYGFFTNLATQATTFTLNLLSHYSAQQGTFGAGSTINAQNGYRVTSTLTGATNNYGFKGEIASGTGRWNLFMDGTASNYLAGDTSIGTTTLGTATKLTVGGSTTAASAIARGQLISPTLVASANNDVLVGLDIAPTFTNGAFTGVTNYALRVTGNAIFGNTVYGNSVRGLNTDIAISVSNTSNSIFLQGGSTNYLKLIGSNGNLILQNGGTFTDAGYRLDVFGLNRFTGTTASDTAPLGSELAAVTGTGTNWTLAGTNLNVGGYTHTVGSTTSLTTTLAAVSGTYYQITYTITGRTAGSITIAYGGTSTSGITASSNTGPLASSTAVLTITPTTDFDGTVVLSIKSIGTSSASSTFSNSGGASVIEMRVGSVTTNLFIGLNTGRRSTTGSVNTFIGNGAGQNNTTGNSNTFIGQSAGRDTYTGNNNTLIGASAGAGITTGAGNTLIGAGAGGGNNITGSGNVAVGGLNLGSLTSGTQNIAIASDSALGLLTTGGSNIAFGRAALFNITTSSNNIAFGNNAARFIANGSTAASAVDASIFIGSDTKPLANSQTNQIVIGYATIGLGSNTTVLGNTSTTLTALYGAVITGGTSVNASAQLQVDSTTKGFLPPRMTAAQRTAIASPAVGLMVYQTDGTEGVYVNTSIGWKSLTMV